MENDMTSRIIATNYVSLDGVIEDPVGMENSGLGDWTGPFTRGPLGDKFKLEELKAAEALLFGRLTYDAFAAVWPSVKDEAGFAERINSLPKYVASSTLKEVSWNATTVIGHDLVAETTALKSRYDGDILIYGSASIVHALAPHGLIDEYRLMIYPTVLGRGKRLFPANVKSTMALGDLKQFDDGIVLLCYRPTPPSN
jgi:dihydrofolate reductase